MEKLEQYRYDMDLLVKPQHADVSVTDFIISLKEELTKISKPGTVVSYDVILWTDRPAGSIVRTSLVVNSKVKTTFVAVEAICSDIIFDCLLKISTQLNPDEDTLGHLSILEEKLVLAKNPLYIVEHYGTSLSQKN